MQIWIHDGSAGGGAVQSGWNERTGVIAVGLAPAAGDNPGRCHSTVQPAQLWGLQSARPARGRELESQDVVEIRRAGGAGQTSGHRASFREFSLPGEDDTEVMRRWPNPGGSSRHSSEQRSGFERCRDCQTTLAGSPDDSTPRNSRRGWRAPR